MANYPPGVLGTFMELYEAEIEKFVGYLRGLDQDELSAQAEFGGKPVTIPEILEHVAWAGMAYAEDARGAVQGLASKKKIELPEDRIEAVDQIVPRMREALEGGWDLGDPELARMIIDTPWGQKFSLDQMMEHAIVHVHWHARQCRRVIAKAKTA